MKTIFIAGLLGLLMTSGYSSQNGDAPKPVNSEALLDVDGDGEPDRLFYEIRAWKTEYEGLVRITSAKNKPLWEHQYLMRKNDLLDWLNVMGDISVSAWAKGFFTNEYHYGLSFERGRLTPRQLSDVQIANAAKQLRKTPKKLKEEILLQKKNLLVSYRSMCPLTARLFVTIADTSETS